METIKPFKVSSVYWGVNENETLENKLVQTANDMFMRIGIKSVSMDDIAREMGVSKKTIYTIVDNKHALVEMVVEKDACQDIEVITANHLAARDAIDEFLRNSRYFIRQMREISPTTMRDLQKYYPNVWKEQVEAHHEEFRHSIAANLERGMEEGLYRDDLDSDIIARFYVGSMMSIIDRTIFPATDRPLIDIISEHARYHFHAITNQFGRERLEQYLREEGLD